MQPPIVRRSGSNNHSEIELGRMRKRLLYSVPIFCLWPLALPSRSTGSTITDAS